MRAFVVYRKDALRGRGAFSVLVIGALCGVLLTSARAAGPPPGSSLTEQVEPLTHPAQYKSTHLDSRLAQVAQVEQTQGEAAAVDFAKRAGLRVQDGRVSVVVQGASAAARAAAVAAGGSVIASVGDMTGAAIPLSGLTSLTGRVGVYVRPPLHPIADAVSEGVDSTGASAWHALGRDGAGVKVAVVDLGFQDYESAVSSGDLPSVTTVSYCANGIDGDGSHGTAVAEIVHDMAPGADLTLICIDDEIGLAQAEQYAAANGITIINHSVSWFGTDSRGDGTGAAGTPAAIVAAARADGILWVNSAGDYAQAHWSGKFTDTNHDGFEDFTSDDEGNSFFVPSGGSVCASLTWDSWPTTSQDYDLYILNSLNGQVVAQSTNLQDGTQPPVESTCFENTDQDAWFFAAIYKFSATVAPRMDLFVLGDAYYYTGNIEYRTSASSLLEPATSPDALAVGAMCWDSSTIEPYSSRGPTIDGRVKPDIVGPDSVSTTVYGQFDKCGSSGFTGTSAAAPHVAGAAALVEQLHPDWTPAQVEAYLVANAKDLGATGRDNTYGAGMLRLPLAAPVVQSFTPTSGTVGSVVKITGSKLGYPTSVDVDGVPAQITSSSPTSISIIVPSGAASGTIGVTTTDGTASSLERFKVTPKISDFDPANGLPGASVSIHGFTFTGATGVRFGATPAQTFSVVDDSDITATVPSGAISGKITVVTPSGSAVSQRAFAVPAHLSITSFTPAAGPVGTKVTVTGTHLDGVTSATIGAADVGALTIESATTLQFTVPTGAATGVLAVTDAVSTATTAASFKVTPKVTGIEPASATPGTPITIEGSSFTGASSVKFGTVNAQEFSVTDDGDIAVDVPQTAHSGKITVTTPSGSGTSAAPFVVIGGPAIASFTPASGPVGSTVTVTGTNLDGVATVTLDDVDVGTVTHVGTTQLKFKVPLGATTGNIALTSDAGGATSLATFKVTPTVSSFAPTSGTHGSSVILTGLNFTGADSVKFGTVAATSFTVSDDDHIVAAVPSSAETGRITVTTLSGAGVSSTSFTVLPTPALSVSSFSPTSTGRSMFVDVYGRGLRAVTDVKVGDFAAAFEIDSNTEITLQVPADAVSGPIALSNGTKTVTTNSLTVVLPPANDSFDQSVEIDQLPFTDSADGRYATAEQAEPIGCWPAASNSLWWSWTASGSGDIVVDATGSDAPESRLDVFEQRGSGFGGLYEDACDAYTPVHALAMPVTEGTTYYFRVSGTGGEAELRVDWTELDGSLDTGFGSGGIASLNPSDGHDEASAVAAQGDGKVVVGGIEDANDPVNPTAPAYPVVVRFDADGSVDDTFGTNGVVTLSANDDSVEALATTPDDELLVLAGRVITELNSDGAVDTGFGTNGTIRPGSLGCGVATYAIDVQPDGKIVVGGTCGDEVAVVRYNADGSLDTAFGSNGLVVTDPLGTQPDVSFGSLAVDSAGTIAVSGIQTVMKSGNWVDETYVVQLTSSGVLDATFGTAGVAQIGTFIPRGLAYDGSGNLIVGGIDPDRVIRLNADGSLDSTFGTGGAALGIDPKSIICESDGTIVVIGDWSTNDGQTPGEGAVGRLNADGSVDVSFQSGLFVQNENDVWYAGVADGDDAVVVAGTTNANDKLDDIDVGRVLLGPVG